MTPTDGPAAKSEQSERSVRPEPTSAAHSERPEAASPPGSVAEEAALLVDLLSRRSWAGSSGMPPAASHKEAGSAAPLGHDSRHDSEHDSEHDGSRSSQQRSGTSTGECTCGGSTPAACRVCPVCQLVAFVQQVNPDTIEKVADFVGFAATALRDLAATQRERRAEPHPDAAREAASEPEPGPASEPGPETTASTTPASATASTSDRTRPGERS